MKHKKSLDDYRQDSDSSKGKRKTKLTPIKKQKSKKTQFFDEIEEDDFDLDYKPEQVEDLFEDLDDEEFDDDDRF